MVGRFGWKFLAGWATLAILLQAPAPAEPWTQWRGPRHDGTSKQERIPLKWSENENHLWKLDLPGPGYSTPCIFDNNIFLTCTQGQDLLLLCIGTNGQEKWRDTLGKGNSNARGDEGNSASASPCTDGKQVWSFVSSGDLHCHAVDGKRVWTRNLQKDYGKFNIQFGMHSTPLLHEGKLYLQLLHTGDQWVICLDAATGKEIWKVKRPSDGRDECPHSYASPTLFQDAGDAYLITHGNDYTVGHSLKDGSEIWRVTSLNPKDKYNNTLRFVASPVASGGLIVVPTAKNGQVVAVKPDAKGVFGPGSPHEAWRKPSNTPDVPSPLATFCSPTATREPSPWSRPGPNSRRWRKIPCQTSWPPRLPSVAQGSICVVSSRCGAWVKSPAKHLGQSHGPGCHLTCRRAAWHQGLVG